MNWKKIINSGIANAAINGAAGAVIPTAYNWANGLASGQPFQAPAWSTTGSAALGMAVIGVINWLAARQKDPIKEEAEKTDGDK